MVSRRLGRWCRFEALDGIRDLDGLVGEPPTGPEDDGNALVWIIVGLIVLAVIGVGAYFYMEEQ